MGERTCKLPECQRPAKCKGYCNLHYGRWKRQGDPRKVTRDYSGQCRKFMALAVELETDSCIVWPFRLNHAGYGMYNGGKGKDQKLAHRVALERARGPAPRAGMLALHAPGVCHNPACINPRHLRWGTDADNMRDKITDETDNRGERCASSKLTADKVKEIRGSRAHHRVLTERYGVSRQTVRDIRAGRTWAWLE